MSEDLSAARRVMEIAWREVQRILNGDSGSGANVNDPCRLGIMHSLLAARVEKILISAVYGEQDRDWFDAGRKYHKNDAVCEQVIRIGATPPAKLARAKPGQIHSMFFDISELTDQAPIPEEVKQFFASGAAQIPVPDASFISRFPLIAVKAQNAKHAARIIAGYLAQAQAEGWKIGKATALVDDWRNEYELTKNGEKTVMRFDVRPSLVADSRLNLVALTLIAGTPKLEEVIRNYESLQSWPEAFASAGLSFVDTSKTPSPPSAVPRAPAGVGDHSMDVASIEPVPNVIFDYGRDIFWHDEALKRYSEQKVRVVGESCAIELPAAEVISYLVFAKSALGWRGASDLFQKFPNGKVGFTLQHGQMVSRADAAELSKLLTTFSDSHLDPTNPGRETISALAGIARAGGFSIESERTAPAAAASKTSRTAGGAPYVAPSKALLETTGAQSPAVIGPPGGVACYRHDRRQIDLRERVNLLNGLYARCTSTQTWLLPLREYLNAAAQYRVKVPSDTMGFVTKSNQLFLNADQVNSRRDIPHAYVRSPEITLLYGPTFADAFCYGYYRLVCNFVGKDEFPTEDDVIQHARDLKQRQRNARQQTAPVKFILDYMREFGEGTPLESAVTKAQKKVWWRFFE